MNDFIYDQNSKTVWVPCGLDADTLVPGSETRHWSDVLRTGALADGREVQHINYLFEDEGSAEYNQSALSFMKIGTWVGNTQSARPLAGGPAFTIQKDFGL